MKTIAIVGRTNVGKSTLFNRLCQKKLAIVHDIAGVTRDRKEATAHLYDLTFRLIDTAGLEETTALAQAMWNQTQMAIEEADIILMVVDARSERTILDDKLAKNLRSAHKPILLVANKCEGKEQTNALIVLISWFGAIRSVSARTRIGFGGFISSFDSLFPRIGRKFRRNRGGKFGRNRKTPPALGYCRPTKCRKIYVNQQIIG